MRLPQSKSTSGKAMLMQKRQQRLQLARVPAAPTRCRQAQRLQSSHRSRKLLSVLVAHNLTAHFVVSSIANDFSAVSQLAAAVFGVSLEDLVARNPSQQLPAFFATSVRLLRESGTYCNCSVTFVVRVAYARYFAECRSEGRRRLSTLGLGFCRFDLDSAKFNTYYYFLKKKKPAVDSCRLS